MLFNITTAKIVLHCSQMNEVWSSSKMTLEGGN